MIGKKIKELRIKEGLSQKELSDFLGFKSPSIVTMWESNSRTPKATILPKLAEVLNCSISELYDETA